MYFPGNKSDHVDSAWGTIQVNGGKKSMSGKNRVFLLAIATAGLIGAMAPAAYAAGPGGNNNSVLNISGNQLPIQACNDVVPVNGVGGDVPLAGIAAALSALSAGSTNLASSDTSCHQSSAQADTTRTTTTTTGTNGPGRHSSAGGNSNSVVNLSNNQVPIELCNDLVPVNGIAGLVPAQGLSGALSVLSPGSITSALQNSSCTAGANQANANTTTTNG